MSVEHIFPESLGNVECILPRGVVCDGCNNYLSRKVEKPVLDSPMMRLLRADRAVLNKRGRLPEFGNAEEPNLPDYRLMSRFIGKIGLEYLAFKTLKVPGWNSEIVDKQELDELRSYVRYNQGETWPFAYRTLYPINAAFEEEGLFYEVLHELDLLVTDTSEFYIVVAIFGVEFALNLGGPMLDGYTRWLQHHEQRSPLYPPD